MTFLCFWRLFKFGDQLVGETLKNRQRVFFLLLFIIFYQNLPKIKLFLKEWETLEVPKMLSRSRILYIGISMLLVAIREFSPSSEPKVIFHEVLLFFRSCTRRCCFLQLLYRYIHQNWKLIVFVSVVFETSGLRHFSSIYEERELILDPKHKNESPSQLSH